MKLHLSFLAFLALTISGAPNVLKAQDGVLIRCGASAGTTYFFQDELTNPDGAYWTEDKISSGKIVLVRLGDEWDIQFDDAVGAYGYRQDGATVIPISENGSMMTIGAFHQNYSDVFTFNFEHNEVVWSSHKSRTLAPKVGIYRAECGR